MYFHISKQVFEDGTIFKPRIPLKRMIREDSATKRICTSQSIDGCLIAIGAFDIGDIVHVYTCDFKGDTYKPTPLQVPDVYFTGEEWILSDTTINKLFEIKITGIVEREYDHMQIDTYSYSIC